MNLIKSNNLFLLEEVVKRNFSSKYKDSVLGIFWSVLRPLLMMILFTIIFSTIFGKTLEYYPVYFLAGRCIYEFFSGSVGVSMNSIRGNKSILSKTAAPKHIFILGSIISEFINFIISVVILFAVMIVLHVPFYFNIMICSIIPVLSILIMITGLGFSMAILCCYYSDIQHLWGVISLMIMYSSALFYPMDIIPEPYHQFMVLNPVFWVIDQFRCFIYQGVFPSFMSIINSLLLSTIILVIGLIIYKKYEKKVTMTF